MFQENWLFLILFVLTVVDNFNTQLVVNVKNKGGDLLKENINANTTQDTVNLEFNTVDGTYVTLFIDMKNVSTEVKSEVNTNICSIILSFVVKTTNTSSPRCML